MNDNDKRQAELSEGKMNLMTRTQALFICIALILPSFSQAQGKAGIPFPTTLASPIGHEYVDADLMKIQAEEVEKAGKEISKKLSSAKKDAAISKILQSRNQEMLKNLENQKPQNVSGLTQKQAEQVLESISLHPVVNPQLFRKYDTWDQMIGYCFGRAAYVHWELLRRGVPASSIGKIFAIGGLRQQKKGSHWDYHVATVVRSTDGDWWVIDILVGKILKADAWTKEILNWSAQNPDPQLRFYFTDANKFLPTSGVYSTEKLLIPEYRGYFQDLFTWFRDHPAQPSETFF